VFFIVGVAAIGGFLRGFVQEVLSLASWVVAIFAIHYLHTDLTALTLDFIGSPSGAAVFAFCLLLLIPYFAMKLIAKWAGNRARASILGPIDRVLGFGFGTVKGVIIVVMGFSLLMLGYDTAWGPTGRPEWMITSRTYPFVNASADQLVQLIEERRRALQGEEEPAPE
jgi:membrane protein required for colicin V production